MMTTRRSTLIRNEIAGSRNSWIPTLERRSLQVNDIVHNSNYWDCAMPGNPSTQENGIVLSRDSWTPVTPRKPIPQRSNIIQVDIEGNQMENDNWQDLIGIYKDLLQGDTLDLNVLEDFNPISPPPMVENSGNPNGIANTTKKNPSPDCSSNQASSLLSYVHTNDPANWKSNLLETIMGHEKSSTCVSSTKNNSIHSLNKRLVPNPSTHVGSNVVRSTTTGSMLGTQQNRTSTSNQLFRYGCNSMHLQADSYHHCCHLNLPPRSEPDAASSSTVGHFPSPNNQGSHTNNQWVPDVKFSVEGISTPTKDGCENQMVSIRNEGEDNQYNGLLQAIGDSSSSPILITQKEHIVFEGNKECIELKKTPEQKTPPKRKKHRPKVVTEWNPKRTPNLKDTTNGTCGKTRVKRKYVKKKGIEVLEAQRGKGVEQNSLNGVPQSVGKRKYVRKKGIENLENQQLSSIDAVSAPVVRPPNRSCKRQLNFDLVCVARDEGQNLGGSQHGIDLNTNPQDMEQERRIDSILDTSALKMTTSNQESPFIDQMQAGNQTMYFPELNVANTPHAKAREHDVYELASDLTMRNGNNQVNQHVHGGVDNVVIQAGCTSTNIERVSTPMLQRTSQSSASQCMLNSDERRGIKRCPFEHIHPCNADGMDSFLMYQKLLLGAEPHSDNNNDLAIIFLESHKRKKTQGEVQATEPSCIANIADDTRQESRRCNGLYRHGLDLQLLSSCTGRVNSSCKVMNVDGNVGNCHFQPPMASPHILHKCRVSCTSTQGHDTVSVSVISSWSLPPVTPTKEKKLTAKQNSTNHKYGVDKKLQPHRNDALERHQRSPTVKGRARKHKLEVSIDDLIYMLEGLHIHDAQNALVPYKGDNSIIPFEPIKKRKPRPKVDLDPETDRVWRLLMGKEGSEGTETVDKDKEKWWEDERRVFHGRVDSFIARMHLVQGDRRFSQWKGSVVDSVIGVFLTQNVTDHLSSEISS